MSAFSKPVLVLAISVLIFAVVVFLAETELLDYVQTYYHNPSVLKSFVKENSINAEIVQNHINELQNKFNSTLNIPAVRSSFLYNQSVNDIYERSRIFGILLETVSGLQSVQFVDSNGIRIHYSTSSRDVINQSRDSTSYRNYTEDARAMPYNLLSVPANEQGKYTMDDSHDRIIFSYPFFDSMDVYRGTALFTLSVSALAERLIAEGRINPSDDVSVIRIPPGVVFGSPSSSKTAILNNISIIWSEGINEHITLNSEDSGVKLALISTKTGQNLYFGRLVNDSLFSISTPMKLILYFSMFFTVYLTIFFLINIKPNPVSLVQNRIRNLRMNLFEQLYINKNGQDRVNWIVDLEQRRNEIRSELKHKLRMSRSVEKEIDEIIDKTWDELLIVMKSGSGYTMQKIRPIQTRKFSTADEPEEFEEIAEVDEVEEIEEVGVTEELEEIDEIEEVDEIEELADFEELEELGEIEEAPRIPAAAILFRKGKGLLARASGERKPPVYDEPKSAAKVRRGLLARASGERKPPVYDEPKSAAKVRRGLLAAANMERSRHLFDDPKLAANVSKGLLAVASEIEFNRDYPVNIEDKELDTELDIVSPFASMFSSLK